MNEMDIIIDEIIKRLDDNSVKFLDSIEPLIRDSYYKALSHLGMGRLYHFPRKTPRGRLLFLRAVKGKGASWAIAGRKGWHRASAPGDTPAPLTGFLRANISPEKEYKKDIYTLKMIPDAFYAGILEGGSVFMEPRPFMHKVLHGNRRFVKEIYQMAHNIVDFTNVDFLRKYHYVIAKKKTSRKYHYGT